MYNIHLFLLLSVVLGLAQGFAIIQEGLGLTAKEIKHGSPVTMQLYKLDEVLEDTQEWLSDKETGQIYLKFYEDFVLGLAGESIQLYDKRVLGTNIKHTFWHISRDGESCHIQSKELPYVTLGSLGRVRETSAVQFFDPFPTFDYVVIGAGTAGAKIAKRLSDDNTTSVGVLEAGERVNDDPFVQSTITWRQVANTAQYNFVYYSEVNPNLGGQKTPAGVGRMWGGTSGHNGFVYDKGLPYDWWQMEKYGGSNWNYEKIKAEYLRMENYTGPVSGVFGTTGEVSICESPVVPNVTSQPFIAAAKVVYPNYIQGQGINQQTTGSATSFQVTMQSLGGENFIREWSASAHLGENVVDKQGRGVAGRKLKVVSVAFVDKLIFHPVHSKRAIGVRYIGTDAQERVIYANKEVIISAGVYNSPTLLLRSGVGNCSELSAFDIPCEANNVYVGSNLHDHVSFQVMFTAPPELAANFSERLIIQRRLVEGRILSKLASSYTDYSITNETQPDTKLLFLSLPPLSGLAALLNFNSSAATLPIFSISPVLVRAKCNGKVSLISTNPTSYPKINHNYLCDPHDYNWTVAMFRDIQKIIDQLSANDSRYRSVYPTKEIIEDDVALGNAISSLVSGYSHPTGSCRMAPRDDANRGVINGDLCVYGLKNVRVADASIFAIPPSGNTQAPIYAMAGRAAEIIKSTKCAL